MSELLPTGADDAPKAWRKPVDVPLDDESDDIPDEVADRLYGLGLAAGGANVVMQLARLPIGHGVARSTVESGRVDRRPIKRLRTTTAFLVIASLGTRQERLTLRRQINRVHALVRSNPGDPVAYDAFDPELQLWVAACLYKGFEDIIEIVEGRPPDPELVDRVLYPHGRRFATTLQVGPELWPEDRAAFERYWQQGVASIEMDDLTRDYLVRIIDQGFLLEPLGPLGRALTPLLRRSGRFTTLGFLPEPFRAELGLPFTDRQARAHRRLFRAIGATQRHMPRAVRQLPLNLYLSDTRRRLRQGRPVV